MAVPPKWLNDVDVRDDSALLQLSEQGVNPFADQGTPVHDDAKTHEPGRSPRAEERSGQIVANREQLQAALSETHRQLSWQQQLLRR